MVEIKGVYVAMATPFDRRGQINETVLREWIDFMIEKGVNGLFPVSTVGEYVHLSYEESCRLIDITVNQVRGRVQVIPGASSSCAANSIRLAKYAENRGCQAVVICPPYLYPVTQNVLQQHYETILEAIKINVVLYNIPAFTTELSCKVIENLAQSGRICAIKDSSGNMKNIMHYLDKLRRINVNVPVLTGIDEILFPALVAGCSGCMSVLAGIAPEINTAIYQAFMAGDLVEARRLQEKCLLLLRAMSSLPFPYGYKLALEARGFPMGPPKQPIPASEKYRVANVKALIEQELKNLLGEKMVVNRKIPGWRLA
ncbi:dihydrodipicolinate synthase family protein [Neomoorella humiferrea]|uniref:dihydrodipicolinate synthase family protein n=1 Tax=Neomoorella humiferrea TaxID=676965 RepID=UPI003D8F6C27